ncbi:phosphatase PAP2 family protein [Niabella ginsengisoli]|uniref:Phosphatase PAP2 family protein n=1 Tax=Niabella ginsengisoli TaxID=522298 RepID=A0ABS9SGQ4_9BACT|nr:phosphatase PAP2 family protein [Niabella ginsengisoli]MCH5597539.1 phosphatase PAP2 family protein [Niabella ginsengisoli]
MSSDTLVKTDSASTASPSYKLNKEYLKSFIPALTYTVSRPAAWNKKDWTRFSIAIAGTGAVLLADWEIRNAVQHNKTNFADGVAKVVEPFGNTYGTYLFPAMYAIGAITKQPRFESAGLTGMKSLVISTIVYTASKKLIRRNRPDAAASSWDYAAPFAKPRYTSSPSGHSNTIFTVATALALEFQDHKWVPPLVYSLASVTAISRIYHNRHWASDVVLGSLMGHFVTKAVWKASQKKIKNVCCLKCPRLLPAALLNR